MDKKTTAKSESELNANKRQHIKNKNKNMIFKLRNVLNTIFIIGAIVGMIYYFFVDDYIGTFIILGAMVFKFTEATIRLLRI